MQLRRSSSFVSKQKGGCRTKHLECLLCSSQKEGNLQEVQRTKEEIWPIQDQMLQLSQGGSLQNQCLKNARNKKRDRDQENVTDEAPPKKNKTKELEVSELYY